MKHIFFFLVTCILQATAIGQARNVNPVFIDKSGIMRWTKDKKEASFFGVNYTVPFAYGYRSHKALGIDPEKAIDADVYHMSRLGLNAFRVHVWDVEISDSLGNLLSNEHLRLFDYLIQKLKEKQINILITPIAFWGNGYPERDDKTNGFSMVYGKRNSVVQEGPIRAQENYLKQFFNHVNPYTGLAYKNDPHVIAMEINNEPHHSGSKQNTTVYINRMIAAVKSTGWIKPVFYNISESPAYADAVVKSNADGYSFQWYPTGLVAGYELKGNFLPHVSNYKIPFGDTIPAFKNHVKMVYEFDAGDVMQPIMYPAMARSFRTAGFQWATQFAYDPMHTAYANTEYQTHYLNLAYTPAKAVSLMIAAQIFQDIPRNKSYGTYPADTSFGNFKLSYDRQLAEMNRPDAFYYTGNTSTTPVAASLLQRIAGTGSSPIVQYSGTGAYFLDKLAKGVWRLEILPDAIAIKDPFEKASPRKAVTAIEWRTHAMQITLPDMEDHTVTRLDSTGGNTDVRMNAISPGVYLLKSIKAKTNVTSLNISREFYAPKAVKAAPALRHKPYAKVTNGKSFPVEAVITGLDSNSSVKIEMHTSKDEWKTLDMLQVAPYKYKANVPASLVTPGVIYYRMMVKIDNETYTFPGDHKGDPYAWDTYTNETWKTHVAGTGSNIYLFDPTHDRRSLVIYNPDWEGNKVGYITADENSDELIFKANIKKRSGISFGWQLPLADKFLGRITELKDFNKVSISMKVSAEVSCKLSFISKLGETFSFTHKPKTDWNTVEFDLTTALNDQSILLPRPYPGFLPVSFQTAAGNLDITQIEKMEMTFEPFGKSDIPVIIEVQSILLKK